jgi:hypothetical protein
MTPPTTYCKNSLGIINGLEYFKTDEGELYRARATNPIDFQNGYRQGGRWQAPAHLADSQFEMIKGF